MRKDLNKVLCESERYGSERSFKEVRRKKLFQADEEFSAGRESMTSRHVIGWNNKEFGEHLNPLYGFVRKNVGRKWDDVYSELCEVFDFRSVINDHILVHLWDYVERHTYLDHDGAIMVREGFGGDRQLEISGCDYYVHPISGILCKNESKSRRQSRKEKEEERKAEERKTRVVINNTTELRRRDEDSPWFVCTIAFLPYPKGKQVFRQYPSAIRDKPTKGFWHTEYPDVYERDAWTGKTVPHWGVSYCVSIRSASKKEIKEALAKD